MQKHTSALWQSVPPGKKEHACQRQSQVQTLCVALVYLGLLRHFLVDSSYVFNLRPLLEEGALAPFLLLVNTGAMRPLSLPGAHI